MNKNIKKGLILSVLSTAVLLSGCSAMKKENLLTGEKEFTETTKWATIGAGSGAAIGGLGGVGGALIGAAVGTAAGGYYGYSTDLAAEELTEEFMHMNIDVKDVDGVIFITVQDSLLFNKGDDTITDNSKKILDKVIGTVRKVEHDFLIKVSGHTDNSGNLKHNISLSENRAKNVAKYLYEHKIGAKAIDYRGFADFKPLVENTTEENMSKNRRVEIQIIPNMVDF